MVEPPNILWIVTDQQRYDALGCYGSTAVATPNLDALAAAGRRFNRCYCTNPICTPSRASMLTGHHLPRHGVLAINDPLADHHVLLPKHLQRLGYHTGLVGKLHVQDGGIEKDHRHPNDGFDVYDFYYGGGAMMDSPHNAYSRWLAERNPEVLQRLRAHGMKAGHIPREAHMSTWAAERTIDFIDNRPTDRPFFCMMSLFDPHNPYNDHPRELEARVGALPTPIPADTYIPEPLRRQRTDNYFADFNGLSAGDIEAMRRGYFASIALIDDEVGRVLRKLDADGLAENTLIVFTSDHGDMLGDHGQMVKGGLPYEANIHVPLIVRWPKRLAAGGVSAQLVQLNDIAALSLAAAGGDARVMPDAVDPLHHQRGVAVTAYRNSGLAWGHIPADPPIHMTVATESRWKLALYHEHPGNAAAFAGQLFDLATDPHEQHDQYNNADTADVRARLSGVIADFCVMERPDA